MSLLFSDALGSIIGLSDENGQMVTNYAYDAFGQVAISGEISDNPFQYTGRENDGTGLYYYRARYYSPELQRFISEDPILKIKNPIFFVKQPAIFNLYNYVKNNPLRFVDPLGLMSCEDKCNILCSTTGGVMCTTICTPLAPTVGGGVVCLTLCGEYVWYACDAQCNEVCNPGCPKKNGP